MMGIWEFSRGITVLVFLVLVAWVWGFPGWHPGGKKSPREFRENWDGEGERNHIYECLFLRQGRRIVAKNETPTPFFDRLSRFFGERFMFC